MRPVSPTTLATITSRLNQGETSRQISRAVGVSKTTINEYRNKLAVDTPRSKGGQPAKLTPREKRELARMIITGGAENARQATRMINLNRTDPVSDETVRTALKQHNLVVRRRIKKPLLSAKHRRARLIWAHKHREWTNDDWKRVIWSDETKINRIGSDGQLYVWCPRGEGLTDRRCQPTVKFGGGSIMLWGCMTWAGVGKVAKVEGRMDAAQFCSILDRCLAPTMDACTMLPDFPQRDQLVFQQDNDPKHTSRLATSWFRTAGIQVMEWPAQSPDLNPIEHLWHHLKTRIAAHPEPAKGVHELWERASEEWAKITADTCRELIESMPRRVEAVIKARGGHTKY